ncbi:calcium-binding mitochondrial carrier protein SCaMC-2-A-like isoform X2 [Rhodnius prolixus]|uniref:calcium-binding mitochondrial carrier protein SCaMC-2-A-like isoform X2 n=1 Tax=Rhodnius prolixus TaxID=13249 RepID=UPI003D18A4C8
MLNEGYLNNAQMPFDYAIKSFVTFLFAYFGSVNTRLKKMIMSTTKKPQKYQSKLRKCIANKSCFMDFEEHFHLQEFIRTEMSETWWRHLLAGGVAGAVSRSCTAPFDRLKIYMQANASRGMGAVSCLRLLLQEGGILSLWRGNGVSVLKITPETAIKFWTYDCSTAGIISQTITFPLEVLKTRFTLRKTGEYSKITIAVKKMYYSEGMGSFYRGYLPNLLGIIPYAGIDLSVNETLKQHFLMVQEEEEKAASVYLLLGCGAASSFCAQLCSYPLALVRTKLQVPKVNGKSRDSMTSVFKRVIETEGIIGLYRGILPNCLKVVPAVSITYVVYEKGSISLGIKKN